MKGPTVLGLLFEGADPSAALIVDGRIVAFAEEERFTRKKHAMGTFPLKAVDFCLATAGFEIGDVDIVSVAWDAAKFPLEMAGFYLDTWYEHHPEGRHVLNWQKKNLSRYTEKALTLQVEQNLFSRPGLKKKPEILFINHHFAHACSSYMLSGFEDSAILTADGHGEDDCTNFWVAEGGRRIRHLRQWKLPDSLGWFYTKFTQFFGFHPHDGEGKLMGLAAYGQRVDALVDKVRKVARLTGGEDIYMVEPRFFYGKFTDNGPFTREWIDLFGMQLQGESGRKFTPDQENLAYAVQLVFEEICSMLAENLLALSGMNKLCVAGGSFMNCKLNGVLARKIGYASFFVQPVSSDNGASLGAALAVYHDKGINWPGGLKHLYLGPEFSDDVIEGALKTAGLNYKRSENLALDVAEHISKSRVVGWFQGRMEAGARALGNRSILANPLDPDMKDIVNAKVKFREPWRPFCPSTIADEGRRFFDYDGDLPFMIVACPARDGVIDLLPSVVHVDNTVRVQTVSEKDNAPFYKVIREFGRLTGHSVVLNTSFNIKGEPIVCSPADAIVCFKKTGIEVLAIGNFIAVKDGLMATANDRM